MTTMFLVMIGGVVAAILGWLSLELAHRHPTRVILLLFVWLGLAVYFVATPGMFVRNFGGINVVVPDLLCAFLALVAGLRLFRHFQQLARPVLWPLIGFSVLLGLSYVRGVAAFGLQHATNEFREFFYFLAAGAFALSFKPAALAAKMPLVGMAGAGLLVLVALARLPAVQGFNLEERVLPSYAALVIGQAFFLSWCWAPHFRRPAFWRLLAFGFLFFSLLMLHRSVWACLAGGLVVLVAVDRAGRPKLFGALAVGLALGGALVALFLGPKIIAGFDSAVIEATSSEHSTFLWRLEGWEALLKPATGWNPVDLLVGRPMGSGYSRILGHAAVRAVEIESGVIPHNYYLSVLLRAGLLGLGAFLWLHAVLIKTLLRLARASAGDPLALTFLLILVTQLIYYIPYSADMIQGAFLGCAISLVSAHVAATRQGGQAHD